MSSSSPPRKPMPRPRRCSRPSTCPSPVDPLRSFETPYGKEKLDREKRPPRQADQAADAAPGAAQGDRPRPRCGTGRPLRGAAEAVRAAAQQLANPGAQPLLLDRAAARLLPQVQAVAHRGARARFGRPDPRHAQIELVK